MDVLLNYDLEDDAVVVFGDLEEMLFFPLLSYYSLSFYFGADLNGMNNFWLTFFGLLMPKLEGLL